MSEKPDGSRSVCYLSNDFSVQPLPEGTVIAPEGLWNGPQIIDWVSTLKDHPDVFATCSLFLLRELHLQGIPCDFINLGVQDEPVQSIEDLGDVEILDRDLEQSERYMDHEMHCEDGTQEKG